MTLSRSIIHFIYIVHGCFPLISTARPLSFLEKTRKAKKKRVILFLTQFFSIPGSSGPPSLQGGTQPNKQISVDAAAQIAVRQREAAAARRKEERRISESIEATERYYGSSPAASYPLPPVI